MSTTDQPEASGTHAAPVFRLEDRAGEAVLVLGGRWTTQTVSSVDQDLRQLELSAGTRRLVIDMSGVARIDTAGAWLVKRLATAFQGAGVDVAVEGATAAARILLDAVDDAARQELPQKSVPRAWPIAALERIGLATYNARDDFLMAMNILGATIRGAQLKMGRGHAVNPAAIAKQIERMGIGAIPVVLLMSSIIGAIIAQQGAFQLRYFGAEIFVVDLVGILVLREIGVLLTAIMIAGRSGSAITAEIGSMKMREEVDALTVIGLNPIGVLVFPRLVALVIALPLLTIAANFAAIIGAIVVSDLYSGIAPQVFIDRMRDAIDLSTVLAGLIKAPFMALIIGIIASVEGLKVGGSAESLGLHVTASVVKAIFVVIVVDGLFAMFYAAIDF